MGEWCLHQGSAGRAGRRGRLPWQGQDYDQHAGCFHCREGQGTHEWQANPGDRKATDSARFSYCGEVSKMPRAVSMFWLWI